MHFDTSMHDRVLRIMRILCKQAEAIGVRIFPFGGSTLALASNRMPRDVDCLIIAGSVSARDRFLDAIRRACPDAGYVQEVDYEDPCYPLIYPGRLDRFRLLDVAVDITSEIAPICGNKRFVLDTDWLLQPGRILWTPFGVPAVPVSHSLIYCLFRAAIAGNDDKREDVRRALEGLHGGQDISGMVNGVSIEESGARHLRYSVGFRGSKLELLIS